MLKCLLIALDSTILRLRILVDEESEARAGYTWKTAKEDSLNQIETGAVLHVSLLHWPLTG